MAEQKEQQKVTWEPGCLKFLILKSRGLHQTMSKLPTRFLVGFTDFDSCLNLTDLYAFSGS